jgi:aminoglycoside/choline kinase family phosphotransferase
LNDSIVKVGESLAKVGASELQSAAQSSGKSGQPLSVALAKDPSTEMHRLTVQHKVPRSILQVLKNQFELMQEWMVPTLAQSQMQTNELQKLREAVNSCVGSYATLVSELESAQPTRPKPTQPKPTKKKK